MANVESHDVFIGKMHKAVKELVTERLEKFLTDGGQLEGYDDFKNGDIGLTEARFREFLDYMELAGDRRWVYINPEKDPRDPRYKGNKDHIIRGVIQYCIDNAVYIWNNGHVEQYSLE